MNDLRWILLAGSIVLLVWVYWRGRKRFATADVERIAPRETAAPRLSESASERERQGESPLTIPLQANQFAADPLPEIRVAHSEPPSLSTAGALSTSALEQLTITQPLHVATQPAAPAKSTVIAKPRATRKVVALRVAATGQGIPGERLNDWFAAHDLRFGKYDIYHRYAANGMTLFSVASMVEPGTFDRATMFETQYPGVSLFLELPAANQGVAIFDAMLVCAQSLQQEFHGKLHGERNALLTSELVEGMRERIADFEHLLSAPRNSG